MSYPNELLYTKDHEWFLKQNSKGVVGVSSYAVEQLGDVVHVELPTVGTNLAKGEAFGTIESTKTVSDIYSPCDGKVVAVNNKLVEEPEVLSDDPYKSGWLIEIEVGDNQDHHLMTMEKYVDYLKSEH